jgi:hypothetical protein
LSRSRAALGLVALALAACAGPRPVLNRNARYQQAGEAAARAAVEQCMQEGEAYAESDAGKAARVAGRSATGAAVGAGTGAVVGAIGGHPGRGAAVGAAGGATASFLRGLVGAREPDAVERAYVERCLRERGYDSLGWR